MTLIIKKPISFRSSSIIARHVKFSKYAILRKDPLLVFDFEDEYYRSGGLNTTFESVITHSRSSNATMIDSDGVLKWAPHNLLRYSEDFTEWGEQGVGTIVSTVLPNGLSGNTFTASNDLSTYRFTLSITLQSGITYTASIWVDLSNTTQTRTVASLRTVDFPGTTGKTSITTDDVDINGFATMTFTVGTGGTGSFFVGLPNSSEIVAGDKATLGGAHLYRSDLGGMVNNPDRNDSYVPTTTAARYLPRRGHHVWNGSNWINEGLLHESESRTNLILNSETIEQKDVYVTGQEYTVSFQSGQYLKAELSETLGVTAVDVFVYDTKKDSDGGAWRTGALAQASSWYNETLNTATRGSRQEFPEVAVIVAESRKVTIYDADDPSLPMWMVFELNGIANGSDFRNTGVGVHNYSNYPFDVTSVHMLNGRLVFTMAKYGVIIEFGMWDVNLLSEVSEIYLRYPSTATGQGVYSSLGNIAQRNSTQVVDTGTKYSAGSARGIIGGNGNDVAMTVLPGAPTDPATGLPVPTIAVATDGGVSVIKDDGTVVDIVTTTANFTKIGSVQLDGDTLYASFEHGVYQNALVIARQIPNADISTNYAFNLPGLLATYLSGTTEDLDLDGSLRPRGKIVKGSDFLASPTTSGGTLSPLCLISEDLTAPTKGMISYVSSTYNTGWMNGDIKGAFLSDTDDTDLVGSGELVTNGTFDTDTSGWAAYNSATLSQSSGELVVTISADGDAADQTISGLTVGSVYRITGSITSVTGGRAFISFPGQIPTIFAAGPLTTNFYWVATSTTLLIRLGGDLGATQATFDNISVQLADNDRSVNNKGLIVNGTITRTPVATGADLVAYSGFSASNYLEQPYNSALDFGTGDFCIMGWAKRSATGSIVILMAKTTPGTNSFPYFEFQGAASGAVKWVGDNSTTALFSTTSLSSWTHIAVVRSSGVATLYINGNVEDSSTNTDNYDHSNTDTLRFGLRQDGFFGNGDQSIALWRISATAPTADQILKIYNDEKVLFQENAKCTLYGTSDVVTALAHDPDTNLLHVGTSQGRSVFDGLRRIDNTTDAVTTAISASGGFIVEQ